MPGVSVIVRPVILGVLMRVCGRFSRMIVLMFVFVAVLVCVEVGVLVDVSGALVCMFMGMIVCVVVSVDVTVFMVAQHGVPPRVSG